MAPRDRFSHRALPHISIIITAVECIDGRNVNFIAEPTSPEPLELIGCPDYDLSRKMAIVISIYFLR